MSLRALRRRIQAGDMRWTVMVCLVLPVSSYLEQSSWRDPSPHAVRFVAVEEHVRLEVLDWGGVGKPVVLLAGGGNTAHVFDDLAPKLATNSHVYGITRRGFGDSEFAASDNPADRLRDDVLAVVDALKLERPVLVGHSIAGAELSAVANSHADRVAGLIYLEAGYPYAFDNGKGSTMKEFQTAGPRAPNPGDADLASFSALQKWDANTFGFPQPEAELRQTWDADPAGRPRKARASPGAPAFAAIMTSGRAYNRIPVPALVIFALPHVPEHWIQQSPDPATREAARTYYAGIDAATARQANALEDGVPTAHVLRMRGAHHIFLSNERETLREMRTFLAALK
jgi:non-heme chloroperoxidase